MSLIGKHGNLRSEAELDSTEDFNNFAENSNNLTGGTTAVNYTGKTSFGGLKVHELLILAGVLVLLGYGLKRFF
jgi:hypothetical protein